VGVTDLEWRQVVGGCSVEQESIGEGGEQRPFETQPFDQVDQSRKGRRTSGQMELTQIHSACYVEPSCAQ
jgi:hypothetical protein